MEDSVFSHCVCEGNSDITHLIKLKYKLNPFLPTGQFFAPKLIILIKCLIDILFF